jgi:hypothetical protein
MHDLTSNEQCSPKKKHELTSGEQCSPKKCLNFPGMSNVHKKYMTFHEMNNDQQNRK